MPIPFIAAGAAVAAKAAAAGVVAGTAATGAVGVKKGLDGKKNFDKAKRIGKEAEKRFKRAKDKYDRYADNLENSSAELGKLKLKIQAEELKKFADIYSELNKVNLKDDEYNSFKISYKEEIESMKDVSLNAQEMLKDGIKGVKTGVFASVGISSLAGKFGVASTGTKVASLSGAAATNAKLAWLGGGALKVGGGGILLGKAVLFGAAAGPALAIAGFSIAKKSEKALTEAIEYKNEVEKKCAQIDESIEVLKVINTRIKEVDKCLRKLRENLNLHNSKLKSIIDSVNSNSEISNKEGKVIKYTLELAKEIRKIMNTDILVGGELNRKMEKILKNVERSAIL